MLKLSKDIVLQVKELMSRNLDTFEIAHRLHIDADDVRMIVDIINNIFT
jgi:hypothetical protein